MYPEEYAHNMLFMCFPFRNEVELKFSRSYANELRFPGVLDTVNLNRCKVEPYATIADNAFERLQEENEANINPLVSKRMKKLMLK